MSEIKTKTFIYGNEKEAEWPPRFGTGKAGPCYYDKEKRCIVDGYPPQRETFGTAPMVIFDSMNPEYHHGACRVIESRKDWQQADEQTGSLTLSPSEWKKNSEDLEARKRQQQRELAADRRKASLEAIRAFRENPTEMQGKLAARAREQIETAKKAGLTSKIKEALK